MNDIVGQGRKADWRLPVAAGLAICAAVYVWSARLLFLDDAFIHLRIAKNLHDLGFYSFNGEMRSYCTSSPLYTALLAALLTLFNSVLLPKIVGVAIYAGLLLMVARSALVAERREAQWLWLLFLAAIASPLGVRWLCDGMETGLVAVVAIVLARIAFLISSGTRVRSVQMIIAGMLLGTIAAMLRVEFCLLIAMIGLASLTVRRTPRIDPLAVSLAVGSAIGLAGIYIIFGALLPDTAVAKAGPATFALSPMFASLVDVVKAHGASSSLGVIVVSVGLYAAIRAIRHGANRSFSIILDATVPLIILAIALRQQAVQGYRYFVFMEFFVLAYNIHVVDTGSEAPAPAAAAWRSRQWAAGAALVIVLFCWQAIDFHRLSNMIDSRAASFEKFRNTDMTDLKGTYGIAWDVGFIGYFSAATILDGNGLVNGRDFARMPKAARLRWFVSHHPIKFVFGDEAQLNELREIVDLDSWITRESFDFPNFSAQPDRHFMIVRPN